MRFRSWSGCGLIGRAGSPTGPSQVGHVLGRGRFVQDAVMQVAYGGAMALRLKFISIVTRDMSASLAFYRLLDAPVPDGSDELHVDTRLEDGIVLAWDTIDLSAEIGRASCRERV